MANRQEQLFEAYDNGVPLRDTCARLSIPYYVAFIWLKKSGRRLPEKIKCLGGDDQKLGAEGEEFFQKLVPEAVGTNTYIAANHPGYDFSYKNITIDVKTSTLNKSGSWTVGISDNADIYFWILIKKGRELSADNVILLMVPGMMLDKHGSVHISKKTFDKKWGEFVVGAEDVQSILDAMASNSMFDEDNEKIKPSDLLCKKIIIAGAADE